MYTTALKECWQTIKSDAADGAYRSKRSELEPLAMKVVETR